jgi:hypothetical protein
VDPLEDFKERGGRPVFAVDPVYSPSVQLFAVECETAHSMVALAATSFSYVESTTGMASWVKIRRWKSRSTNWPRVSFDAG